MQGEGQVKTEVKTRQGTRRGLGEILLQSFQKAPTQPTCSFRIPGPQNCETMNFCCVKTPSLQSFVTAPIGD